MNEEIQQIQQIAFQFLGLVFGVKTNSPEELMKQVQAGLSSMEQTSRDELAKESMAIAQGIKQGEITQEQVPQYVQQFREKYKIGAPLSARLGGVLNYINKLNTIR